MTNWSDIKYSVNNRKRIILNHGLKTRVQEHKSEIKKVGLYIVPSKRKL